MYNINNGVNIKEILYSAQKNTKNKGSFKNYEYESNKKYPPYSKTKMSNKYKNKSLINEVNNFELNLKSINSKNNTNILNPKNKNNSKQNIINQDMMNNNNINNNHNNTPSLYFQMNINMKDKNIEEYINHSNKIYNSSGKQKNIVRKSEGQFCQPPVLPAGFRKLRQR